MKRTKVEYIIVIGSVLLLILGLYWTKTLTNPQGFMKALPYICIGVGCGFFGHSMGNIISRKALKQDPILQKQIEIDKNDERNITIANQAKAKAYDMMTFVFAALMLSFALMEVDMVILLLFVFAYLFVEIYAVYCRCKYDKIM